MRTAAFFDLDGALSEGDTQFGFLGWLVGRRLGGPTGSIRPAAEKGGRLLGRMLNAATPGVSAFAFLRDTPISLLAAMSTEFFRDSLCFRIRDRAAALVESHRSRGDLTVLVTSACEPIALPAAEWLGIGAVMATRLLSSEGRYVCPLELPEPRGMGKRVAAERFCAEHGISVRGSHAYCSGVRDGPLLDLVGHPVAVNPDRRLRRAAQARGWPIIDLTGSAETQSLP